jgi:hypothetical protein
MGMPQAADAQAAAERLGCPVEAPDR